MAVAEKPKPKKPEPKYLAQIELVAAMMKECDRQGFAQLTQKRTDAIIKAANSVVAVFGTPVRMAADAMGLGAWLMSDDTGMSSKAMAAVICSNGPTDGAAYPYDPSDFGRCYRMLRAVPEARAGLDKMKECGPVWKAYVENWDELEKLYEEELPRRDAPKLWARMMQLQGRPYDD